MCIYDYYATKNPLQPDEWVLYKRKHQKHEFLTMSIDAFLTAQKYGTTHGKTKDAWYDVYKKASLLEYFKYNRGFNPSPEVFYDDLSKFCMYDKLHDDYEKLKVSNIMMEKANEFAALTKMEPLKEPIRERITNYAKMKFLALRDNAELRNLLINVSVLIMSGSVIVSLFFI